MKILGYSLVVLEINKALATNFGPFPTTLLFEYITIDKLTAYFVQHHEEILKNQFGINQLSLSSRIQMSRNKITPQTLFISRSSQIQLASSQSRSLKPSSATDIAIVGLSGDIHKVIIWMTFGNYLKKGKALLSKSLKNVGHGKNILTLNPELQGKVIVNGVVL